MRDRPPSVAAGSSPRCSPYGRGCPSRRCACRRAPSAWSKKGCRRPLGCVDTRPQVLLRLADVLADDLPQVDAVEVEARGRLASELFGGQRLAGATVADKEHGEAVTASGRSAEAQAWKTVCRWRACAADLPRSSAMVAGGSTRSSQRATGVTRSASSSSAAAGGEAPTGRAASGAVRGSAGQLGPSRAMSRRARFGRGPARLSSASAETCAASLRDVFHSPRLLVLQAP